MEKNNSLIKIIQNENNFGVYRNMEKQKFDRMKTILGILMLVFVVVPLTAVTVTAASDSGNNGGHGGHGGWGGPGWGGPFGYYPPAPYGMGGDSNVICGPYGCALNEPTAYLPQAVIAEQGW